MDKTYHYKKKLETLWIQDGVANLFSNGELGKRLEADKAEHQHYILSPYHVKYFAGYRAE